MIDAKLQRIEHITRGDTAPEPTVAPGVLTRVFVSAAYGAAGLSTGTITIDPGAELPYHRSGWSEVITFLQGQGSVLVEGRAYQLAPFDCIHVPAGIAYAVRNPATDAPTILHWAFATASPTYDFLGAALTTETRSLDNPEPGNPEHISRFDTTPIYELSPGAFFRDLFKGSLGSVGVCGGYGRFRPGASLPCHFHEYDESITIVEGKALCLVQGNRYEVGGCDTALVPVGRPHRFINESDEDMAMIWVYAGSEPERTLIAPEYCSGALAWPGPDQFRQPAS